MRVLVTGAGGQLGRSLHGIAGELKHSFIFTGLHASEHILPLDITDAAAVSEMVRKYGIDAIVNCAAYTDVEKAEDDIDAATLLNVDAPGILADIMKERGGLLVHISTDYVFGGEKLSSPINEICRPAPCGVYGLTKLQGEERVKASGCKYVILRTSWLYSEFGRNFVKTMLRLTAEKQEIKVVDDQTGTPTYARDLALAISAVLDDYSGHVQPDGSYDNGGIYNFSKEGECSGHGGDYPHNGIYNYSDEGSCTWHGFASLIAAYAGRHDCRITPCSTGEYPAKAKRPAYSVLDKSLFKKTFGVEIPQWQDSLRECIHRSRFDI